MNGLKSTLSQELKEGTQVQKRRSLASNSNISSLKSISQPKKKSPKKHPKKNSKNSKNSPNSQESNSMTNFSSDTNTDDLPHHKNPNIGEIKINKIDKLEEPKSMSVYDKTSKRSSFRSIRKESNKKTKIGPKSKLGDEFRKMKMNMGKIAFVTSELNMTQRSHEGFDEDDLRGSTMNFLPKENKLKGDGKLMKSDMKIQNFVSGKKKMKVQGEKLDFEKDDFYVEKGMEKGSLRRLRSPKSRGGGRVGGNRFKQSQSVSENSDKEESCETDR